MKQRRTSTRTHAPDRRPGPFFSPRPAQVDPSPFFHSRPDAKIRRQPAEEEEMGLQRQPSGAESPGPLHEGSGLDGERAGLSRRLESARGGGRPLPADLGTEMEAALGADLGPVRIHDDGAAAEMSDELRANAFTRGHDIYFASGRYAPETRAGLHLLAHELTHVIQQRGGGPGATVQADFAVEPTTPDATARTLSADEIAEAIAFNARTITDADEIRMLRDILGLGASPATLDADFIRAVVAYQALYGLTQDGKIGGRTRRRLSLEILAEARSLGSRTLGGLATGVQLRRQIRGLINAGNTTYATYRARIRAASVLQRDVVLADPATLRALRDHLPWNDFARCVELLGRRAPTFGALIRSNVVRTALRAAWTASNPAVNPPVGTQHEEGGWVYLDLITNRLSVRRQAAGAAAALNLASPPIVPDNIVVAKFHTHPNLGPGWVAGPSLQDATVDAAHGVPDIVVGSNDVNPATFDLFASGPNRRAHLAGNQGLPGAGGGLAPQARKDGSYDEQ